MLRLVAGMIAAFIVGGLVAMPFTSSSIAAQEETANEDTVCCDATAQYDTLEFATRADCQRRNGIVVENIRCEPDKEMVCCDQSVAYGPTEFTTREVCKNNGNVVENNRCEPNTDNDEQISLRRDDEIILQGGAIAMCNCGCASGDKEGGIMYFEIKAPGNDANNCQALDGKACSFTDDGKSYDGTTMDCTFQRIDITDYTGKVDLDDEVDVDQRIQGYQ